MGDSCLRSPSTRFEHATEKWTVSERNTRRITVARNELLRAVLHGEKRGPFHPHSACMHATTSWSPSGHKGVGYPACMKVRLVCAAGSLPLRRRTGATNNGSSRLGQARVHTCTRHTADVDALHQQVRGLEKILHIVLDQPALPLPSQCASFGGNGPCGASDLENSRKDQTKDSTTHACTV